MVAPGGRRRSLRRRTLSKSRWRAPSTKEILRKWVVSSHEKPVAQLPIFGYCSCPSPMIRRFRFALLPLLGALLCSSCKREEIRVYTVAKQPPAADPSANSGANSGAEGPSRPRPAISYTLPPDWKDLGANEMSLANIHVKTEAGEASVNITPLGSMAGGESAIVNMWREQVGQPPLPDSEAAATLSPVDIGGESGQLFEITGQRAGEPLKIVTAFVHRSDGSWFYKMQGPEIVVTGQKPAFIGFLKSVHIQDTGATAATAPEPAQSTPQFHWKTPEGWQTLAPGQMQVAKFALPARGDAKAEVFVSIFPSDTGGVLANVNRWRRQVGLGEIDEAGLKSCVSPLEGVPDAILVSLTNENRSLLGAIVPRNGQWWFYKLLGDTPAITPEHDNFVHFAQSPP